MTDRAEEETIYTVSVWRGPDLHKRGTKRPKIDHEVWHDEKGRVHRLNGPADIVYSVETGIAVREAWLRHGQLHRSDAPALVRRNATTGQITWTAWYVDGEQVPPPKRRLAVRRLSPSPT